MGTFEVKSRIAFLLLEKNKTMSVPKTLLCVLKPQIQNLFGSKDVSALLLEIWNAAKKNCLLVFVVLCCVSGLHIHMCMNRSQ